NASVVIYSIGFRLVDLWIDNPNVTVVPLAHLPNQESENLLVEVLRAALSPSAAG
ncbi:hypothetical protein B9Z19DRAFT_987699, partial [Tuber borchii]